jgi:hypothetical protein
MREWTAAVERDASHPCIVYLTKIVLGRAAGEGAERVVLGDRQRIQPRTGTFERKPFGKCLQEQRLRGGLFTQRACPPACGARGDAQAAARASRMKVRTSARYIGQ